MPWPCITLKIYHKSFNLRKANLLNLENFNPRNFPAIWYVILWLAKMSTMFFMIFTTSFQMEYISWYYLYPNGYIATSKGNYYTYNVLDGGYFSGPRVMTILLVTFT